jgi:hypothetical protein
LRSFTFLAGPTMISGKHNVDLTGTWF